MPSPAMGPLVAGSSRFRVITTARAISSSKFPIAVAVSISPRNKITSQVARFFTRVRKGVLM
jgi:hypothetical protein